MNFSFGDFNSSLSSSSIPSSSSSSSSSSSLSSSLETLSPKDKWLALNVELSELCAASDTDAAIDHLLREGSSLLQAVHCNDIDDTFLQNDEDLNRIQNYFHNKDNNNNVETKKSIISSSQLNFYAFLDKVLFQSLLTNISKVDKDTVLYKALENIIAVKENIVKSKIKKGKNVNPSPTLSLNPPDLIQSKQFRLYMDHVSNNSVFRNKLILLKFFLTLIEDDISNDLTVSGKCIRNTPIQLNIDCAKRLAKSNVLSRNDLQHIVKNEKEKARLRSFQSKSRIILISGMPSKIRNLEIQGKGVGFIGGTKITTNIGRVYFEVSVKGDIKKDIRVGWANIDLDPKCCILPGDSCDTWAFDAISANFYHNNTIPIENGETGNNSNSISLTHTTDDPRLQGFLEMLKGGLDVNAVQWIMRREGLDDEVINNFLSKFPSNESIKSANINNGNMGIPLDNCYDAEDPLIPKLHKPDSVLGCSLCTETGETTLYINGTRVQVLGSYDESFAVATSQLKSALESSGVRPIISCINNAGLEINLGQAPFKFPLDEHIGIAEPESESNDSPIGLTSVSPYLHFPLNCGDSPKLTIENKQLVNNGLNGFTIEFSVRLYDSGNVTSDENSESVCSLVPSINFQILDKSSNKLVDCSLVISGDGILFFEIDSVILCQTPVQVVDKNIWRHIAFSFSCSKGSEAASTFIDGELVHKADLRDFSKTSPAFNNFQVIHIGSKKIDKNYGKSSGSCSTEYPWDISELRVWSTARIEENIKGALGRSKISGIESNLICCLLFVEGGGNYIYNSSLLQDTDPLASGKYQMVSEPIKLLNESGACLRWEQNVLTNPLVSIYDTLKELDEVGPITNVLLDNISAHFQLHLWSSVNLVNKPSVLDSDVIYSGLGELFSQILLSMSLNIENYSEGSMMNSRIKQVQQLRNVQSVVDPHVLNFVLMNSILRQILRALKTSVSDDVSSLLLGLSIVVIKLLEMNLKAVVDESLSPASVGLQFSAQLESCNKSFVAKLLVSICHFISLPIVSRKRNEKSSLNHMIEIIRKVAVDAVITGFDIFLPHVEDRLILFQCLLYRKRLNNPSFVEEINFPSEVPTLLEKSNPNTLGPDSYIDPLRALLSLPYDGETLLREALFKMFTNVSNASKLISPLIHPLRLNESLDDYIKIGSNVSSHGECIYPELGEIVERGPDWKYDNQDGSTKGNISKGVIINIEQWCEDNKGTCITVLWLANGSINSYRWGVNDPLVSTSLLYDLNIYRKSTFKEDAPKDLYERKMLKYTPDEVLQSLVSQVGELSKRTVLTYIIENSTAEWQERNSISRSINSLVSKLSPEEISKVYSAFYATFGFKKSNSMPFLKLYSIAADEQNGICMCDQLKQIMVLLARDISLSIQESNVSSNDESSHYNLGMDFLFVLQGIISGVTSTQSIRQYNITSPQDKIIRKPFTGSDNKLMKWDWRDCTWSSCDSEVSAKSNPQEQSPIIVDPDIKVLDDLTFDSSFVSDNLIINDDCKTVEQSGHNQWNTAVGSLPMHPNTGVYRWYSRVDSFGGKRGNCIFGIASEDCCCESFLGYSEDGWGLTTNQELFHEGNKLKSDFGPKVGQGTIVEITLDTNTGTLIYAMPQLSNQPEVAFTCLDEITYYPAWSLYATGDSISILSGIDEKIQFSSHKLRDLRKSDQVNEVPGLSGVPSKWIIDYSLELIRTASKLLEDNYTNIENGIISVCLIQLISSLSRWQCINPYEIKSLISALNELIQRISNALTMIPFNADKINEAIENIESSSKKNYREYLNQTSCVVSAYLGMLTSFLINGGGNAQISNLLIAKVELEEVHDQIIPSSLTNSSKRDWLKTKIFSQGFRSIKDSKNELITEFVSLQSTRFSLLFEWLEIHDVTHINFQRLGGSNLNHVVRLLFGAIVYHSGYFRALATLSLKLSEEVNTSNHKNILENFKPPTILMKAWEYAMKFRLDTKEEVVREGTSYEVIARRSTAKLKLLLDLEQYKHEIDCPGNTLVECLENWQPRYQNHIYQILSENSTFCRSFASDKSPVSFLRANLITTESRASTRKDGLKALRTCIGNLTEDFGWGLKCAMLRLYPVALKLNTSCIFHNKSQSVLKTITPKVGHYLSGLDGCSKSEKLELKGAFDSLFSCFTEELVRSCTGGDISLQLNIIACLGTQILEDDHVMLSRVGIFNVLQELLDSALSSSQNIPSDDDNEVSGHTFKKVIKATMKLFILLALQVASSGESEAYHTLSISRDNSVKESSSSRELKPSKSGPATLSSAVFRILYTLLSTVMNMMTNNLKKSDTVSETNVIVSVISHDAYVIIDETTILLSFISKEPACQQLLKNPRWLRLLLDLTFLSPSSCQPRAMMILSYLLPSMDSQEIERASNDLSSLIDKYSSSSNIVSTTSACDKIIRIILNQCSRSLIEGETEVLVTTKDNFSKSDIDSIIVPVASEAVGLIRALLQSSWSEITENILISILDSIKNEAITFMRTSEIIAVLCVLGGHIDYPYPQSAVIIDNGAGGFDFGIVCNTKSDVVEVVKQIKGDDNYETINSYEKIIVSIDKVKPVNRVSIGDLQVSDAILKKVIEAAHVLISNKFSIGEVKQDDKVTEKTLAKTEEEISDATEKVEKDEKELVRSSNEKRIEILKTCAIRSLSSLAESRILSDRVAQIIKLQAASDANIIPEFLNNLMTIANADSKSNGVSDIPIYEEYLVTLNIQRQKLVMNQILKKLSPAVSLEATTAPAKSPKSSETNDSYLRLHDDKEPPKSDSTQFPSQRSDAKEERIVDSSTIDLLENMGFPRRWCEIALQLCGDDFGEAVNYILSNGDTLEHIANDQGGENVLRNYFNDENDDEDMDPDECEDQESENFFMSLHQNLQSHFGVSDTSRGPSMDNPKEYHYIETATRFLPLYAEPDERSDRQGCIIPGDDVIAYAEVKNKSDGLSWLKIKLADHEDDCQFSSEEHSDQFHDTFVYIPRIVGGMQVIIDGNSNSMQEESRHYDYPSDLITVKAVYKIVGSNGAMVREGIETESAEVILLNRNEVVHVCEECFNSEGKLRLRINHPVSGWISKLVGLVSKMFEEKVNPDCGLKEEVRSQIPLLSDMELLNQLDDDMEQWIGGDIFSKDDRFFGTLQGIHYNRSKDASKSRYNAVTNRRSRIMGTAHRNAFTDLTFPSTYLDDLILSKVKTLSVLHSRKIAITLFLSIFKSNSSTVLTNIANFKNTHVEANNDGDGTKSVCSDIIKFLRLTIFRGDPFTYIDDLSMSITGSGSIENLFFYFIENLLQNSDDVMQQELTATVIASISQNVRIACSSSYGETSWYDSMYQDEADNECLSYGNIHFAIWASRILIRMNSYYTTLSVFTIWNLSMRAASMSLKQIAFTMCNEILNAIKTSNDMNDINLLEECLKLMSVERLQVMCAKRLWYEMEDDPFYSRFLQALIELLAMINSAQELLAAHKNRSKEIHDQIVEKEKLSDQGDRSVIRFEPTKSHMILSPQSDIQGSWTVEFWVYCHNDEILVNTNSDTIGETDKTAMPIASSYLMYSANGFVKLRAGGRLFNNNGIDDPEFVATPVCENALCLSCGTTRNATEKSFDFIIPCQEWVHLALSCKGSNTSSSTVNLFVNGELKDAINIKFALPVSHIGRPGQSFNGDLAEMRIWSHARAAAEIKRDMNIDVTGAKGLLLHLKCLEGSGTRIYDSAGYLNVSKLLNCSWIKTSGPKIAKTENPAFMLTSPEEFEGIYGEIIGDSAGVIEMTGTITRIGKPGVPQGETSDNSTEVICLCYRMKDNTGETYSKKCGEIEGYLDWCDRNVRSKISGSITESGKLEFFIPIENSTILGPPESMEWLRHLSFSGHFHDGELAGSVSIEYCVKTPSLKQGEVRLDMFSIPKEVEYKKKSDSKELLSVKDGQPESEYIITVEAFPKQSKQLDNESNEEFKDDRENQPVKESLDTYGLCSGQGSVWVQWYIEKSNGSISFGVLSEEATLTSDSCVFANPDVWCYNVQGSASHSTDISVITPANVGDIISVRIDTNEGILEFYRNDVFIHHFANLRDHPAFINAEESNSNGLRLFVCLTEGEAVKYLGPKEGTSFIKYDDENHLKRVYVKGIISDGHFNGIIERRNIGEDGYYYGECKSGKQHGVQLFIGLNSNDNIKTAYLFENGNRMRELSEVERNDSNEESTSPENSIKSEYKKLKASFLAGSQQSDPKDDPSDIGQLRRVLSRSSSRSPRSENPSVTFRLRDRTGSELHFKVSIQVKIQKVFDVYASKRNVDVKSLQFSLDGERITGEYTPEMLDIQENDTIDVSFSGDPVVLETLLKKSTAPYILQIVLSNGATVRSGIEIEDSASVRMLQCGEVVEAYNKAKTKEGIIRYRISDGWISEKLRGGNEDQVISILRVLPPKPLRYKVVREGGAKVRVSDKLNSDDVGVIPFDTTIEIAEKILDNSEGEPIMRLRISSPVQWTGWISEKSHIVKALEVQEEESIDPDILNELFRRSSVRQRKAILFKEKSKSTQRFVNIQGNLRLSSKTLFLIGGSQKKPGLSVSSDFSSVVCDTSIHGRVMALGSRGFSRGIHYWEVSVESAQWGSVFIGVAPGETSNSWGGYGLLNYRATQAFGNETLYGSYFGAGDTVGVLLDMDHGTLSFFKDGQFCSDNVVINMGVAYHNLRRSNRVSSTELFPCFGMKATNDKLTIRNSHWVSNRGLGHKTKLYHILEAKSFLWNWKQSKQLSPQLLQHMHDSYIRQCSDNKTVIKSRPGIEVIIDTKDSVLIPEFDLVITSATQIIKSRYGKGKVLGMRRYLESIQIWFKIDSDSCGAWYWTKEEVAGMIERGEIEIETETEAVSKDKTVNNIEESKENLLKLEDFIAFMINPAWSIEEDEKIVSLVNRLANKLNIDPLRITSKQLEISRIDDHVLHNRSASQLQARYAAICVLNKAAAIALPFLDFGISSNHISLIRTTIESSYLQKPQAYVQSHFASSGQLFVDIKGLVFTRTKLGLWNLAVKESTINTAPHPDEFERPEDLREVTINRIEARHASQNKDLIAFQKCLSLSVFGQLMNGMRSWDDRSFRRGFVHKEDDGQARAFFVKFVGEGVDDHGGPYRAVFQTAIGEEASSLIGLLTPSANSKAELGENRDKFVFDPIMSSNPDGLPLYTHLGKLLGVACRHSIQVNLSLPQLVWKPLVGEVLDLTDLDAVDRAVIQSLDSILHRKVPEESIVDLLTQALLTDLPPSSTYPLDLKEMLAEINDGTKLTEEKVEMICTVIKNRRLVSHLLSLQYFYRGLSVSLPTELFSMFTSNELENLFCGASEIDINVLKKATVYDGVNPTDRHIKMFWSIIEKMSQDELSKLINFCSGRSRLPDAAADFTMKFKLIAPPPSSQQKPDEYLPIAQTCFFSLSIPEYTTEEIASSKLKYAISNTELMDADFVMHNAHGWENVNDDKSN